MNKFLAWFRGLSLFAWHNQRIKQQQDLLKEADRLVEYWYQSYYNEVFKVEEHNKVLKDRIDEWIARSESSRYKQLYEELRDKVPGMLSAQKQEMLRDAVYARVHSLILEKAYIEELAARQARMLDWIQKEMRLMYPNIIKRASALNGDSS